MREYEFELRLCAHLEDHTDAIVARQLGGGVDAPGARVLDVVAVEAGPGIRERAQITAKSIPPAAIAHPVGPGRFRRWPGRGSLDGETAERVRERAVACGFFEERRRGGQTEVRQTTRYPDWFTAITAIENKPDLDRPGDLLDQLRFDVSVGLVDRVIVATESYVTGAHRHRLPDPVGIWRVERDGACLGVTEIRPSEPLAVADWGIEIVGHRPAETRIRPVTPAAKRRARIRLAEWAYGSGWRPQLPGCARASVASTSGTEALPYCDWKDRVIDPGGCGPACPGFEPAPAPHADHDAERAERTPWVAAPEGVASTQIGLEDF